MARGVEVTVLRSSCRSAPLVFGLLAIACFIIVPVNTIISLFLVFTCVFATIFVGGAFAAQGSDAKGRFLIY